MIILRIYWRVCSLFKLLLFKLLFGSRFHFPVDSSFRKNFGLYVGKNAQIRVGHNVFFNRGCAINCLEHVEIADNCIFGENVKIYDQNHRFSSRGEIIRKQGYNTAPVKIGSDCWVCTNVVILKGVTIGNHCVIGAGCVVNKDIPDNSIVRSQTNLVIEELH